MKERVWFSTAKQVGYCIYSLLKDQYGQRLKEHFFIYLFYLFS